MYVCLPLPIAHRRTYTTYVINYCLLARTDGEVVGRGSEKRGGGKRAERGEEKGGGGRERTRLKLSGRADSKSITLSIIPNPPTQLGRD